MQRSAAEPDPTFTQLGTGRSDMCRMTGQDLESALIALTTDENAALESLSEADVDNDVAIRAEVIQWYAMGQTTEQIVRASGLDSDTVHFWKARFLEFGVEALLRQSP